MRKKLFFFICLIILLSVFNSWSLIGPDQNLEDFPPWIWPYIRPVGLISMIANGPAFDAYKPEVIDKSMNLLSKNMEILVSKELNGMKQLKKKQSAKDIINIIDKKLEIQNKIIALQLQDMNKLSSHQSKIIQSLYEIQIKSYLEGINEITKLSRSDNSKLKKIIDAHSKEFNSIIKKSM